MKERNFVRLDSNNKFVQGSNIRRTRKPAGPGRWYEIFTPNCCEVTVPAGTPGGNTYTIVTVYSGDQVIAELDANSTNLVTVASIFNQAYPGLGEWSGSTAGLSLLSPTIPNLSLGIRYANSPSQGTTTTSTTTTSSTTTSTSTTSTSSTTTSSTSTSTTTSTTTTTLP